MSLHSPEDGKNGSLLPQHVLSPLTDHTAQEGKGKGENERRKSIRTTSANNNKRPARCVIGRLRHSLDAGEASNLQPAYHRLLMCT